MPAPSEIGGVITVTVIASAAQPLTSCASTLGGPGTTTTVPGLEIFRLAFQGRQVGLASALAVVLVIVLVPRSCPSSDSRGRSP
ncbi:MAG: hypothetical protein R3C32_01785 [Chloroflexota bacterium]